jgi:hypothetical protein
VRVRFHKHPVLSLAVSIAALTSYCIVHPAYSQIAIVLDDKQFNEWVFNGNREGLNVAFELSHAIKVIDRGCHLSHSQKERLRSAGREDYAQFMQQFDELRRQCVGKSYEPNNLGKLSENFEPLSERYETGLLDDSSQFAKVLHETLTRKQGEYYRTMQTEWRKAPNVAMVQAFVTIFEQSCALTPDQRARLADLVLKETPPIKQATQQDWNVMLTQANKISNEKVAAVLDKTQMPKFKKTIEQARRRVMHFERKETLPDL